MATIGPKSSGSQFNKRGVAQGVTLVDPITGLPISTVVEEDGSIRLAVDANVSVDNITVNIRDLNYTTDNVAIKGATGNQLVVNSNGSINADTIISGAAGDSILVVGPTGNTLSPNADGSLPVTQSGSWTVSLVNESIEIGKVDQGTPNTLANAWPVEMTDGTNILGTSTHPVRIDPTGTTTQPISGIITADQGGSWTVAATQSGAWTTDRTWTLSNLTDSVNIGNFPASQTINGTVTVIQPTGSNLHVDVDNFPATVAVTQSTSPWIVSGTVTANAGIGNFTVVQSTGTNLHTVVDSGTITANQGTSPWVVSGTVTANAGTGTFQVNVTNSSIAVTQSTSPWLTSRNWTLNNTTDSVNIGNFPSTFGVTQSTSPWVVSGTVTANQGTSPWLVSGTVAATQSGSWTVAATQSGTWTVSLTSESIEIGTVDQGNAGVSAWLTTDAADGPVAPGSVASKSILIGGQYNTSLPTVTNTQQVALQTDSSGRLLVNVSNSSLSVTQGTSPWIISGTVTANAGTGTFQTNITNSTLAVTQSGTWTVQQGTPPWSVSQSGSWTVAATQSGTWSTGRTWTLASGTDSVSAVQSGTWNITNISGTISLPTGASTSALQTTGNASLVTIATNTTQLAQGSTTSGQSGELQMGAVTTASPSYSNGQTNSLSLTTAGALRVDGSAVTQPVSGTVAVTQSTSPWIVSGTVTANAGTGNFTVVQATASNLNAQVVGNVASLSSDSGNPIKTGGVYNSTPIAPTNGQRADTQVSSDGSTLVASRFAFKYQSGAAAAQTLKTGAGILHTVTYSGPSNGSSIEFWDNTAASGTIITLLSPPNGSTLLNLIIDAGFTTGLTYTTTGTGTWTITYR